MNDHQQISAERGRRAADLRAAAVALLEQQSIAAGVMLDLDSDQVVAAGPKAAILYLLSNGTPAATSGDAPDLQQLKALALGTSPGPWYESEEYADNGSYSGHRISDAQGRIVIGADVAPSGDEAQFIAAANPAVVLGLIARIERAAAPAPTEIALDEGHALRREEWGNGAHRWLLFNQFGKLKRALGPVEEELVDSTIRACAASPATASGDELQTIDTPELRDDAATGAGDCATAIRALKLPTPTHSSEAGDA